MAIVINSAPGANYSAHGDLIYVVYEATKANDPTTYPDYKYVADVYIGGELITRIKKVPQPDNKRGVFNIGNIVRNYIGATFNPSPTDFLAQELGQTDFFVNVTVKFGEEYNFTLYTNLTIDAPRTFYNHYNGRLIGQNTNLTPFLDKFATIRPFKTAVNINDEFTFIPYFPYSGNAYDVVISKYGSAAPGSPVTIEWGYFASDPYATVDSETMQFSLAYASGSNSLSLNYTSAGTSKYLVLKEPSSQPIKTTWYNTILNNGTVPDSVFRSPTVIGSYRYYVSRIPVVLDSTNYAILYGNGNPSGPSPVYTQSITETITPTPLPAGAASMVYTLDEQLTPDFIDDNAQVLDNGSNLGTLNSPGTLTRAVNAGDTYLIEAFCEADSTAANAKMRLTTVKDGVLIYDEQIPAINGAYLSKTGIAQPGSVYISTITTIDTTEPVESVDIDDDEPVNPVYGLHVLNVSPGGINTLAPGFIDSGVEYYTVQIGSQTFRFDIVCEARFDVYRVHFLNKQGGFETRNFSKVSRPSIKIEKTSFGKLPYTIDGSGNVLYHNSNNVYNESKSVYASQFEELLSLNTDILNDDEYTWLGELMVSPLVYLERDSYFLPMNITATNYEFRKQVNDKLTNLTIDIVFGDQFNAQYR
jgi:hypothetical protein